MSGVQTNKFEQMNSQRSSPIAALLLLTGAFAACGKKEQPPPPTPPPREVRIDAFLGHPVSRLPDDCKVERTYTDEFSYKTQTCLLEESPQQLIYATFLDDEAFPGDRGRLLKAYTILSIQLHRDATSFRNYMTAFQEKYGPVEADESIPRALPARVLLCNQQGGDCRTIVGRFTSHKNYNSQAMRLSLAIMHQDTQAFSEVSLWDQDLLAKLSTAIEDSAAKEARQLVK